MSMQRFIHIIRGLLSIVLTACSFGDEPAICPYNTRLEYWYAGSGTQNMLFTSTAGGSVSGRLIKQDAFENGTALQLTTKNTGSSEPHPNMPPYYVLAYIMKL